MTHVRSRKDSRGSHTGNFGHFSLFRPKLSLLSQSLFVRVIEGCERSIGRNPFATCPRRGRYSLNAGNDHDPSMGTTPVANALGVSPDPQP